VISQPLGNGRHAPVAAEDQARLIAAILADPGPHRGQIHPLFGTIEMDQSGIASAVSEVIGRPVGYEPSTIEACRKRLEGAGVMPPFLIQHLCAVAQDYQDGIFAGTDEVIGRVTGKSPMTVQEFVTHPHRPLQARGRWGPSSNGTELLGKSTSPPTRLAVLGTTKSQQRLSAPLRSLLEN
jgi:NAD(P)H dehydrogenase (quinone)